MLKMLNQAQIITRLCENIYYYSTYITYFSKTLRNRKLVFCYLMFCWMIDQAKVECVLPRLIRDEDEFRFSN